MIPTTTMLLPKPETGDDMEPFFLGQQPDGGYWMTVERLSEHDHTGGLLGKPITAATIPDGSITASKLDPSVLAPYSLTDGSKPFTGQVTMQADAIVRDALYFGQQGAALAPDVTLTRDAANHLQLSGALGVAAPVGQPALAGSFSGGAWSLAPGTSDGRNLRLTTGYAIEFGPGGSAATKAAIGPTGTVILSPDAGQPHLVSPAGSNLTLRTQAGGSLILGEGTTDKLYYDNNRLYPLTDNQVALGVGSNRYTVVYAVAGAINTSAAELKQDIAPLDPAAALAAVLATDPVTFTYTAPAPTAAQYELPDDPEQAERVLHQRLVNAPLLEAARSQAGFVLSSPDYATDPLFETGTGQSNAANTAGVLLAAVKALATRVTALEGS